MMHKIQSAKPNFPTEDINNILNDISKTLEQGILTDGPCVKDFEHLFSKYIGVKHSIAVNSGTSALEIPLRYLKINNKEVIVTTNTFVATPNSVIHAGGKPVFAGIRRDTLCIDPDDIKKKISSKTVGVIIVHIAGYIPPQIDEIKDICSDEDLFLIEDAAHAHGASIDGRKAGSLCHAGTFSFYPTKVMTTGEGGMITTNDDEMAYIARCLRNHGQNNERQMVYLGHNWRMSEIAAIFGKYQLKNLDDFIQKRNSIAKFYSEKLNNLKSISLFEIPENIVHSYYKYPIFINDGVDVVKIQDILFNHYKIETGNIYYPPCHLHPYYKNRYNYNDLIETENILRNTICLPMHVDLSYKELDYICESLIKVLQ